ncbi:uncharacterized protein [Brachyistius frenatus]|uniref:uncharacterized protein isoform X3 n=1 Tax=Brachyistius frenatus TaxID=100188 RepID=UPI0037E8EBC8
MVCVRRAVNNKVSRMSVTASLVFSLLLLCGCQNRKCHRDQDQHFRHQLRPRVRHRDGVHHRRVLPPELEGRASLLQGAHGDAAAEQPAGQQHLDPRYLLPQRQEVHRSQHDHAQQAAAAEGRRHVAVHHETDHIGGVPHAAGGLPHGRARLPSQVWQLCLSGLRGGLHVDSGSCQVRGGGRGRLQAQPVPPHRADGRHGGHTHQQGTVHGDDGSLLPEEEDRLLCHPDVHAVLHDRHPVPGVLLAKQRVGPREDRLRGDHRADHDHPQHQRQELPPQSGLRDSHGLVHRRLLRLRLLRPHRVRHRQLLHQEELGLGRQEGAGGAAPKETRPRGAVQEAQQRVLGGTQLHPQPHQGRVRLHHLQHHVGAAAGLGDQDGRPQEDLQQRQQDRQDVADSVPRPLRDLQPRLLGHVPEQRTGGERSRHLDVIALFLLLFFCPPPPLPPPSPRDKSL